MQQIVFLENQLSELEEQISSLLHETNQYITTISGIGDVLGAIIVGEIGDINRFERPNQLVAFAGLDVTVKQSGEFSGTKNKISKRGSPYLRRAIWLAAQRAAFCDPVLSEYYQSLRARGKHHLTAVGGVAANFAILFSLFSKRTDLICLPLLKILRNFLDYFLFLGLTFYSWSFSASQGQS